MAPTSLQLAIAQVAPLYNIAFVIIILFLFAVLFSRRNKRAYLKPWRILYFAIVLFIIEQSLVILSQQNIMHSPDLLFPIIELIIITSFIYMVLDQKLYLRRNSAARSKARGRTP